MIDLSGKVLLVTGGGGGIGAATVRLAVELGGKVVLHDVKAGGAGERQAQELGAERCRFVAADLAKGATVPGLWREALAWHGRIDVLVNNAGIYEPADVGFDFADWEKAWHRTLEICLVSPGHLCREAIRSWQGKRGGIIVNLASRAGFRGDDPDYAHYAAAKGGMVALTRTLARGYAKDNITCFAVAPGFVRTALNQGFFDKFGVQAAADTIPLGEVAEPVDVAHTIVFLASGLARHATGTTVHINGASYVH
jgi:NAD(P)-dependent dehydrogenase (short-subunit alcohol dehydrogenase family)